MKLVTYNIQYGVGKDWKPDLARIVQAVDGADVIALQEVVRHMPMTDSGDQPAELAALLPNYYGVYGARRSCFRYVSGGARTSCRS